MYEPGPDYSQAESSYGSRTVAALDGQTLGSVWERVVETQSLVSNLLSYVIVRLLPL